MSSLFAVVSDIHSGSKVAVCPPAFTIDEGTYRANKWQAWLWARWVEYWEYIKFKRGKGRKKKTLHIGILGEIGEGDHHGSLQNFVPGNVSLQKDLAMATLQPMLSLKPDFIHIRAGTEAHSGKDGQFDEMIAKAILKEKDINVIPNEHNGKYAPNMGDIYVENVLFDLEHHGKTGNLPWTTVNGAMQYANILLMDRYDQYETFRTPIPDVALRGHKHTYVDTYKNTRIRLIGLNGWKAPDNFFHRITIGKSPKFGGVLIECNDKEYSVDDSMAQMAMPRDKPWRAPE